MEKFPTPPNSTPNPNETFGLTLEELEIAENEFVNLDENAQIILYFTSTYRKDIFRLKDSITNLFQDYEDSFTEECFTQLKDISDKDFDIIFDKNSFFGEEFLDNKYPEKNYRIKPKYYNFVKNKADIFFDTLE